MARFEDIRKKYRVPLKRGMTVRSNWRHNEGVVTGSPRISTGQYINVRTPDGKVRPYHPYALDYFVCGAWVLGDDMAREYDAAWDSFNARLNRRKESEGE